jgi:hypothetical protein
MTVAASRGCGPADSDAAVACRIGRGGGLATGAGPEKARPCFESGTSLERPLLGYCFSTPRPVASGAASARTMTQQTL